MSEFQKKPLSKTVTIEAGEHELMFNIALSDHDRYVNELSMDSKIAPGKNLLRRTLKGGENEKEILEHYINLGCSNDLVVAILEDFKPEVEITVKKSSAS